jgi:hypothetical protein
VEKRKRKTLRIELTPDRKQDEQSRGEAETVELKVEELERRVTPRPIGTFF